MNIPLDQQCMQRVILERERNVRQFAFFLGKETFFETRILVNNTGPPTSAILKIIKCCRVNVQNDTTCSAFIPRVDLECESFIFVGAPLPLIRHKGSVIDSTPFLLFLHFFFTPPNF